MDRLWIRAEDERAMRAYVLSRLPEEACGLLAGREGRAERLFLIENELHSPTRFRMAPQAQLDALIWIDKHAMELAAIFHSHPRGPAYPSETDVAEFAYPGAATLIWAPEGEAWRARAFRIEGAQVEEIAVLIDEG